jgi:Ser/Thr protein kinase RdoA (MazF antagonist)
MSTSSIPAATQAVQQALTAYGLNQGEVDLVKYRENHVFRLRHQSGDFAVRLHRAHYNDNRAIQAELELLRLLQGEGFNVPTVVPTSAGDLFTTTSNDGVEQTVSVLSWIPDAAPLGDIETAFAGTSELTAADLQKAGELAGTLHNFLTAHPTTLGDDRPKWDFEGLVGTHAVWGDPFALQEIEPSRSLITQAVAKLGDHLTKVGKTADNYSIIHADLTPENILVADDRFVLIDLDDFGTGWHAFEIATLLFWFQRHPLFAEFKAAALAGYAHTRTRIDDGMLDGMLLARGLTYLGWAADRRGDETAEFIAENLVEQVADNATRYLQSAVGPQ